MVALGIATLLFLPLILVGDAHAFFRMPCSQPVTVVRADPIVSDGKVASHLHTVLGSNGFDFSVDYDGLRNGTCSTCLPRHRQGDASSSISPAISARSFDSGDVGRRDACVLAVGLVILLLDR
ncbi:hypothetical protein BKA62DRAFT_833390 [Auriculariales sp. MPI-PUGE-AT-0066]|nr:hypothetical protein BKA62DRAFT_833390 [Auriculariales sp. MPI-PUGE-AT-0066]